MSDARKSPRPDILTHMQRASTHLDFQDAQVLEIGGDRWQASADMMTELGAEHVTIININPAWRDRQEVSPRITKMKANANHLREHFSPGQFDIVYGIAVLEHISDSWLMLDELAHVLKPGGRAYLHGGPIWSSAKGHHLHTKYKDRMFRFSDPDCPIGNWEHLIHDTEELADQIEARGLDAETASYLANWVHTTEGQNRYGYKRLAEIFENCPLTIAERYDTAFKGPNPKLKRRIKAGAWGDEDCFDVFSVTYVLHND